MGGMVIIGEIKGGFGVSGKYFFTNPVRIKMYNYSYVFW